MGYLEMFIISVISGDDQAGHHPAVDQRGRGAGGGAQLPAHQLPGPRQEHELAARRPRGQAIHRSPQHATASLFSDLACALFQE